MKYHIAPRMIALLLALAMLLSAAALAEDVILVDTPAANGGDIVIEDVGIELFDIPVELDPAASRLDISTDIASVEGTASSTSGTQNATDETQIVLGVKEKYALDAKAIGGGKKVTFKTSKKSVATVSSKGVIQGVKKGSAKITCYVSSKAVSIYEVRVVAAPGKVTLDKTSVKLGVKESIALTPRVSSNAHASYKWSVQDKKIASVTQTGVITGKKAGKTTVTVKTQNGKTAKVTVYVRKAPGKVTLNKSSVALKVNKTVQLKAQLPDNTYSAITWSSSDEGIATVSDSGLVTAVAVGTAQITATTFNNRKASCEVEVKPDPSTSVTYRALLIGEENFYSETATRNRSDVAAMSEMLESVKGYYGGSFAITRKYDLSSSGVLSAIRKTFAEADDDDVSLFFIATHGDVDGGVNDVNAGALMMSPSGMLTLRDLAMALGMVPGKVIVILESCGSGAAVYANNANGVRKSNKALFEEAKQRTEAFDAAVVKAFSNAESGLKTTIQGGTGDSGGPQSNTGEFRVSKKFYVLTASRFQELSWGWESGMPESSYNYFTMWLTEGIGTSGDMPADTDGNGKTTLNELYQYISDVGDNYPFRDGGVYYQHVQVYPANSSYVLFRR